MVRVSVVYDKQFIAVGYPAWASFGIVFDEIFM
jgi:hypothetical protein